MPRNSVSRSEVLEILQELIRTPSVNPSIAPDEGCGEEAIAKVARQWLEAKGIRSWLEEAAPGRPSTVAEVGGGTGGTVVFCAHLDTVGTAGMTIPPFEPTLKEDRVYGRGSYDMKGSAAAVMAASLALAREDFPGRVLIALVADEEYASIGAQDFVKRHKADGCVLTEPSEGKLILAHKGFLWAEIITKGRAAHGSRWDLGVSAIALPSSSAHTPPRAKQENDKSMTRLIRKIALAAPLLCVAIFAPRLAAQQSAPFSPEGMDSVLYGVAYYPEYMPTDRLDTDVDLMQKAGITVVRVGESTWSNWEPRDGEFQFAWMQRVLDRLHKANIKVILGTPTYSVPVWLYKEHPEILVTHLGDSAPPLFDPYLPTYPGAAPPGEYGVRQNYDFLNPAFRRAAERVIREIVSHFKDHPAVIGYQIDNETFPTGVSTKYTQAAFLERLKGKFKTVDAMNKAWGLVYWGQLVDSWDDLPPRDGILNPGYKLEWENFQHDIVTDYLAWQAKIVNEYKRPDQFITHDFSGGVHTNLDQWAIAKNLDVVSTNIYFATQDEFAPNEMWLSGDLARSLKGTNYLVTETNAQSIGWDSRTQYPFYPGQLRLAVYTDLAAGANMVEYWHWSSLHYGQETYWRGVLSHDLQPNRTYAEVTRVAGELKRLGPQLVNLKPDNKVAILFSADSANALSYMRFSDRVAYMTVLRQMYNALCSLNIEPDFVPVGKEKLRNYKLLLVPPLYSASDLSLEQLSDYVRDGGQVLMSFKSGFTNEYSTVRDTLAPGPLREAAGFHYQEFSSLAAPQKLTPDAYHTGDQNMASVWQEFLVPDTASVIESLDHPYWHFPTITRNKFGKGTLTYEATFVTDTLQREIIRDRLNGVGLTGPDQDLPAGIKVRHGRNAKGELLHYYLNYSGVAQSFSYSYHNGVNLLTNDTVAGGSALHLQPWDLAIIAER